MFFAIFQYINFVYFIFLPNDTYNISVIVLNNNCTRRDQLFFFNKGIEFSVNVTAYKKNILSIKTKRQESRIRKKNQTFLYLPSFYTWIKPISHLFVLLKICLPIFPSHFTVENKISNSCIYKSEVWFHYIVSLGTFNINSYRLMEYNC